MFCILVDSRKARLLWVYSEDTVGEGRNVINCFGAVCGVEKIEGSMKHCCSSTVVLALGEMEKMGGQSDNCGVNANAAAVGATLARYIDLGSSFQIEQT